MTDPVSFLRRTPLRRMHEAAGMRWAAIKDAAVVSAGPGKAEAASVMIADLSPLPRLGFKGRGTIDAMKRRGVVVEAQPNRAFRQPDGGLCLVLAPGEVILLSGLNGEGSRLDQMLTQWRLEDEERTYPLLRRDSHAWFALAGRDVPAMLAKLCAIDLRPGKFPDLAIAQTSVAKMSAILTRFDTAEGSIYHVLADSAAALYFCSCLLDAAHEFSGCLVGHAALKDAGGAWPKEPSSPQPPPR
jgi:sarcosine oxidase subunit gamma